MNYSKQWVIEQFDQGEPLSFLYFWCHNVTPGQVTSQCLSQWYPCDFTVDGVRYHTTEQYMMAQKALLFGDQAIYEQIMAEDSPAVYKKLGRKVHLFDGDTWNAHKFNIVVAGNVAKFGQNPDLKEFLLGTGHQVLVEASPYDNIWGVRLGSNDPRIQDPHNWQGTNLLGFALMTVRDMLTDDLSQA